MGVATARKYIVDLHKRQNDPFLWPDYLTGLPDKAAIIRKLEEIYPKLGDYAVAYVRIANIHPYLLKYGPNRHAEIIQWAAASLKAGAESCRSGFVGTLNTHDFILICKTKSMEKLFGDAKAIFDRKAATFYSKDDAKKKTVLHFNRDNGQAVRIGLMKLIAVVADRKLKVKRQDLIQQMGSLCDALEGSDQDTILLDNRVVRTS